MKNGVGIVLELRAIGYTRGKVWGVGHVVFGIGNMVLISIVIILLYELVHFFSPQEMRSADF
jgi:hypothetical protein